MKVIILVLTLAATAGIAIFGVAFVVLPFGESQAESSTENLEDKYPTLGGQQMRPRF